MSGHAVLILADQLRGGNSVIISRVFEQLGFTVTNWKNHNPVIKELGCSCMDIAIARMIENHRNDIVDYTNDQAIKDILKRVPLEAEYVYGTSNYFRLQEVPKKDVENALSSRLVQREVADRYLSGEKALYSYDPRTEGWKRSGWISETSIKNWDYDLVPVKLFGISMMQGYHTDKFRKKLFNIMKLNGEGYNILEMMSRKPVDGSRYRDFVGIMQNYYRF